MIIRFPKLRREYIPEKNKLFQGAIIGLCVVIPFWSLMLYIIFG